MDPDARLMVQFRKGKRAAFEALFDKYNRPVFHFCFRFLGNSHDAEEIAQDTFIQVFQAAPQYEPRSKFSTWLYTIAKNRCLNKLRAGQRETPDNSSATEDEDSSGLKDKLRSNNLGPDRQLEQKELSNAVQEAVRSLPESIRLPLILRRYQDLSYNEIAEIMEISVTAVKLRLHRAKPLLAQKLAPYAGSKKI